MRQNIYKLLLLTLFSLFFLNSSAQICTGSLGDPVVNETFGAGTTQLETGPPLPNGVTTLMYTNDPCGENDSEYGLASFMQGCHANTWQHLNNDHTGDPYGYFMLINGPNQPEVVYSLTVDGSKLCPNTTYEFASYIMNVLILSDDTKDFVLPNLTFSIETKGGKVLQTLDIGDIAETVAPQWNQYGISFTTPSDGSDIVIKLIDNQTAAGYGNDFAIDDLTVSPCGPVVSYGFNKIGDVQPRNLCPNNTETFTMVAAQVGYDNPVYQWQQNLNDGTGWIDIPGANSTTLIKTFANPKAGTYYYRIGVAPSTNSSAACRIYSLPLTIQVDPYPVLAALQPTTGACTGQPLQFTIDHGDTYQWTGPNGFNSTVESPVVTASADPSDNGVYSVAVTSGGCTSNATTTVTVYPEIIGAISNDTTVCQGSTATLSAAKSSGQTTFTWTPSTGLDHTDSGTVNATPDKTTTYTVMLSNDGCIDIAELVTVTVLAKPVANAGANKSTMEGVPVQLNGSVAGNDVNYYWTPVAPLDNPNSLTPTATLTENTIFTLHAATSDGCGTDTSSVFVRVHKKVAIPNTFTPNNDGVNDYWDIKNLNTYPECSVLVFNRYGQQVYQSNGYAKPWDGSYAGSKVPEGTYYYIIDLQISLPKVSGWVLIVR